MAWVFVDGGYAAYLGDFRDQLAAAGMPRFLAVATDATAVAVLCRLNVRVAAWPPVGVRSCRKGMRSQLFIAPICMDNCSHVRLSTGGASRPSHALTAVSRRWPHADGSAGKRE